MAADLGQLLQDYAAGQTDSGLISLLQKMNLPLNAQTTQFLADEQDMAIASGRTGLFNGWSLPAGATSRNDFFAMMTSGEAFAAASGWQFFPTPQQLQWAANNGVAQWTQQQQWSWMAGLNPKSTASMPWLQAGMNKQSYQTFNQNMMTVWDQYTGDTSGSAQDFLKGILPTAASQNWSAQQFTQWIQNNKGLQQAYGWIQHGMNYNDFQQYKLNNQPAAAARFGSNLNDSNYLTMLNNPLTQFNAQSSAVQSIPQAPSGPATAGASGFGRQGESH